MTTRRLIPLLTALWAIVGPTICACWMAGQCGVTATAAAVVSPGASDEPACCRTAPVDAVPDEPGPSASCSYCDQVSSTDAVAAAATTPLPLADLLSMPAAADAVPAPTRLADSPTPPVPCGVGPPRTLLALGCMLTC